MHFRTAKGPLSAHITHATVAGWTGRDREAVAHHIAELAELGVTPPSSVPLYYRVAETLLTQAETIQVLGTDTSGEVEPLVIRTNGRQFLGLASDHTDRALEATSVAASKQICAKPIGEMLWDWDEISDHLEDIQLTTDIEVGGTWVRYQDGNLAAIRPLEELIAAANLPNDGALLCGTLGAIEGVRPASVYRMAMTDPVLKRAIHLNYRVNTLPIVT